MNSNKNKDFKYEQSPTFVKMAGKESILFKNAPYIIAESSVVGKKEGEGPLGTYFDEVVEDALFGGRTWEEGESKFLNRAAKLVIQKANLKNSDIRYIVGGDLLGQLISTSFGVADLEIPLLGVFGACSTMGESMIIASVLVDGGYADKAIAITSSHFASAEKEFRFPLGYGNQRAPTASYTVTGSGAVIISSQLSDDRKTKIRIKGATIGKIVDYGIKDNSNMGASMAPAAANTIGQNLKDLNVQPGYYDRIITGDLGHLGSEILIDLLKQEGFDISSNHMDCGIVVYDKDTQDTHAGGSGCACCAVTLSSYILMKLKQKEWKRVLFCPTGSLQSKVSFNEGQSMPGIAHAVIVEAE